MNQEFAARIHRADVSSADTLEGSVGTSIPEPPVPMLEGLPAIAGVIRTAAVRTSPPRFIGGRLKQADLKTTVLEAHGNTAMEIGRYRLYAGDHRIADQGQYLVVWKHAGGEWKLHRGIWTTHPAAEAPVR